LTPASQLAAAAMLLQEGVKIMEETRHDGVTTTT
jgi:hypothetical protein